MNLVELKKHYRPILSSDNWILFIESLEAIEAYNLLSLQRDSTTKEIINYRYLDKLTSFKNEISIKEATTKSSFDLDIETNELKFRLTTNKDQHYPDRPSHTGTIIFNQKIVIEPGVEYIYGLWKRDNDNLYLTMIPKKNLELLPTYGTFRKRK